MMKILTIGWALNGVIFLYACISGFVNRKKYAPDNDILYPILFLLCLFPYSLPVLGSFALVDYLKNGP